MAAEYVHDVKIVRILLVGDPQCGKTSIILALVGEEFPLMVPSKAEEITIPGDVTPEKVPTHIVDFSAKEQDDVVLHEEIYKADVVCVVYDVTEEDALDRVTGYWLPLIKQCCEETSIKPVILAANKSDLPYDADSCNIRVQDVLNAYVEVETGIECSAKDLHNISELFYFAQKAVLHPSAPLYSISEGSLKPDCVTALERIFKICDADNDGILCDQEINDFQIRCFDAPLQPQALQDVKNIVQHNTPLGVYNDGLTLEGFLFLNKLFILRGRHETTWKVLRRFGYNNSLTLRHDYIHPMFSPQLDHIVELSQSALKFLIDLFKRYDKDGDQALCPNEQEELYSLCPEFMWDAVAPFIVDTNSEGWITLDGFLAYWVLQTTLDYSYTAQFLAWMGYAVIEKGGLATALTEVHPNDHKSRKVYRCRIMGGRGCGKTSFCRSVVVKNQESLLENDNQESICIKSVPFGNSNIYLILHESSYDPQEQFLAVNKPVQEIVHKYDVVCLLYDRSDRSSFQSAAQIFNSIESTVTRLIPCVFVSTKSDLPSVEQVGDRKPEDFCVEAHVPHPLSVSCHQIESVSSVVNKLVTIANDPSKNLSTGLHIPHWLMMAGFGLFITAGLGSLIVLLFRLGKQRS